MVEFDAKYEGVGGLKIGVSDSSKSSGESNQYSYTRNNYINKFDGTSISDVNCSSNNSEYHHIKLVASGTMMKLYYDNNLKKTITGVSWLTGKCKIRYFGWYSNTATHLYVKNLTVKPYSSV